MMPTKNPSVSGMLESPRYRNVERLAGKDGVSLPLKVRDFVRGALEIEGDIAVGEPETPA
jgi:hypothetical protein